MSFCLLPLNVNLSKSVNRNLADDSLKSILEVPAHLFTVLLCCLLAALDLIGDTKDQGGPLLDYGVKGYSTVVLFGNNLCRSSSADGCQMSDSPMANFQLTLSLPSSQHKASLLRKTSVGQFWLNAEDLTALNSIQRRLHSSGLSSFPNTYFIAKHNNTKKNLRANQAHLHRKIPDTRCAVTTFSMYGCCLYEEISYCSL